MFLHYLVKLENYNFKLKFVANCKYLGHIINNKLSDNLMALNEISRIYVLDVICFVPDSICALLV